MNIKLRKGSERTPFVITLTETVHGRQLNRIQLPRIPAFRSSPSQETNHEPAYMISTYHARKQYQHSNRDIPNTNV